MPSWSCRGAAARLLLRVQELPTSSTPIKSDAHVDGCSGRRSFDGSPGVLGCTPRYFWQECDRRFVTDVTPRARQRRSGGGATPSAGRWLRCRRIQFQRPRLRSSVNCTSLVGNGSKASVNFGGDRSIRGPRRRDVSGQTPRNRVNVGELRVGGVNEVALEAYGRQVELPSLALAEIHEPDRVEHLAGGRVPCRGGVVHP